MSIDDMMRLKQAKQATYESLKCFNIDFFYWSALKLLEYSFIVNDRISMSVMENAHNYIPCVCIIDKFANAIISIFIIA